ncbi:UNVERIFIED_CONTAM: hypothetical protein Slati_2491200 [Sesamum latifolium]|uniref:Uncharacterized protein n=1 Tax=Sesamum latifolium TaxID=2727402 RepID=A0AAW2WE73_9LAMI
MKYCKWWQLLHRHDNPSLELSRFGGDLDSSKTRGMGQRYKAIAVRRAGGLTLLWRKDVLVQLRSYSRNHINADVLSEDTMPNWRFTGFYKEADMVKRKEVWDRLVHLTKEMVVAWICAGDFNKILSVVEKTGR